MKEQGWLEVLGEFVGSIIVLLLMLAGLGYIVGSVVGW